jgi:enamine deaminase RidA (YjgF/YER057c/UK114 family)
VAREDKPGPGGRGGGGGGGGRRGSKPERRPPALSKPPPAPVIEQPTMRRRLALLGLRLPDVKPPAHHYVPVVVHAGIAHVSGQLPWLDGKLEHEGKVAEDVTAEQAEEAARRCVLQGLAWLNQSLTGGLDEVERVLRVTGYVASSQGFNDQPKVIDAASELLIKVFGHAGHHARSALGVAELPRNAPVEIEFTFAIKRRPSIAQRQRRPGFPVVETRF